MCAWFKRKPKPKCIVCGDVLSGPVTGTQTLEGLICPACERKLDFHTEPEWQKIPTMSRQDLIKQIEVGTQRQTIRERKTAIGEYLVVVDTKGLPIPHAPIIIELLKDKILFEGGVGAQKMTAALPYSRLLDCTANTEYISRDADASPALRALIGGALLGTTGAIMGASSAMNEKYLTAIHTATIKYKNKSGKTDSIILFSKFPTQLKPGQVDHIIGPSHDNPYTMFAAACRNRIPRTTQTIVL